MKAEVIRYENLTFPEVDALPRDIPLLIPLGDTNDYDWDEVIDRVQTQRPDRFLRPIDVCVFPASRTVFEAVRWKSIRSCSNA